MDFPGAGRLQEPPYPSHGGLRISPTSSGFRSPHSVYSPASSFPRCQQPMGMNHASLDPTTSSSRGPTQLPNACVPSAPSPVPHDVPSETAEPTIKKRKRADARQLEALNGVYARTAFPSTEERQQLARDLDMSAGSVQNWLAHTFLYTTSIISELPTTILSGTRTKGRRAVKADEIPPTLQPVRPLKLSFLPSLPSSLFLLFSLLSPLPSSSRAVLEELQPEVPTQPRRNHYSTTIRPPSSTLQQDVTGIFYYAE